MLELILHFTLLCLVVALAGLCILLCLGVLGVGIHGIVEFCRYLKTKEKPSYDSSRSSSHD